MDYYVSTERRQRLITAFHKTAMAKSPEIEAKVITATTKLAFARELAEIDPSLDLTKTAGFGDFLKKWGPDIALTALMFVPGVNVVAGAARVGLGAYRAARIAKGAYTAAKAARTAYKGSQTLRKGVQAYKGLRTAGQGASTALKGSGMSAKAMNLANKASKGFNTAKNTMTTGLKNAWNAKGGIGQTGAKGWGKRRGFADLVTKVAPETGKRSFSGVKSIMSGWGLYEGVPAAKRLATGNPKSWGQHTGGSGHGGGTGSLTQLRTLTNSTR
jgi:hypothetical protein